jgi:hypothetical protein
VTSTFFGYCLLVIAAILVLPVLVLGVPPRHRMTYGKQPIGGEELAKDKHPRCAANFRRSAGSASSPRGRAGHRNTSQK